MKHIKTFVPITGLYGFVKTLYPETITVVYFDGNTSTKLNLEQSEYNGKYILKFLAINDGYYIVMGAKSFQVMIKGSIPYYVFVYDVKNKNPDSIPISVFTIDGRNLTFNAEKIYNKLYCFKADEIDSIGFVEIDKSKTVSPFNMNNSKRFNKYTFTSKIFNFSIIPPNSSSFLSPMSISSKTTAPKITTTISNATLNSRID